MEPVEITAGRLHLRPWQPSDADAVLTACSDPEIQRWTTVPSPYTEADAQQWVGATAPAAWAHGTAASFAVVDATSGALLASCGLDGIGVNRAEIGYWCAAPSRRQGVVTEAVGAVTRWGFGALGLTRIGWNAAVGNWASRRVAERSGYTVEGISRGGLLQRGEWRDCWAGARLAADPDRDTRQLPSYPPLSDGVVTLRPWQVEDADAVRRACSDPLTVRFLPVPSPYTLQDGLLYTSTIVPASWADGTAANVAVTDAATGELVGAVGLKLELRLHGVGEVGYWTAPWARGRGLAGRAARLHAQWGLSALGLNRIELLADVANAASQRVAEKGGFVREGVLRRARVDRTGEARAMVLYSRIR